MPTTSSANSPAPEPEQPQLLGEIARSPILKAQTFESPLERKAVTELRHIIRGARVIGIGDNPHGSEEAFVQRARLSRYLIESEGFTRIGLECHAADGRILNIPLISPDAPVHESCYQQSFWMYRSQVVAEFLSWLQRYNISQPEHKKVQLFGFDCQGLYPYRDELHYLQHGTHSKEVKGLAKDLTYSAELAIQCFHRSTPEVRACLHSLASGTRDKLDDWLARSSDSATLLAIAPVALDALELMIATASQNKDGENRYGLVRDQLMAKRALAGAEKHKTILWAHAYHLSKGESTSTSATVQGEHLHRELGERYKVIGCVAASGQAIGTSDDGLAAFQIPIPPLDAASVEALILAGMGEAVTKLCALRNPLWGTTPLRLHHIGAVAVDKYQDYVPSRNLAACFDGLLMIRDSKPLRIMG